MKGMRFFYALCVFTGMVGSLNADLSSIPQDRQLTSDALNDLMKTHNVASSTKEVDECNLILINTLNADYFKKSHIKNSINIPLDSLQSLQAGKSKDKKLQKLVDTLKNKKMVVVYCANSRCSASHQAYAILNDMGVKNLYIYEGGVEEWGQHGFKLEGSTIKK